MGFGSFGGGSGGMSMGQMGAMSKMMGGGDEKKGPVTPIQQQTTSYDDLRRMMSQNYSSGSSSSGLEALKMAEKTPGYSFNYKNPNAQGATTGRQYGIMTADLKKTPAGQSVVKPGPDGMDRVDTGRLTMQNTAAIGELSKKIDNKIGPSDQDEYDNWMRAEEQRKANELELERLAEYYKQPANERPPEGGSTLFGGNAIDYRRGW